MLIDILFPGTSSHPCVAAIPTHRDKIIFILSRVSLEQYNFRACGKLYDLMSSIRVVGVWILNRV
jgi:hypothetical protein